MIGSALLCTYVNVAQKLGETCSVVWLCNVISNFFSVLCKGDIFFSLYYFGQNIYSTCCFVRLLCSTKLPVYSGLRKCLL